MVSMYAADVTRAIGPTVPRWQLGDQLEKLRSAKELSRDQVAKELGVSTHTVRKFEQGHVPIRRGYLTLMLDMYETPTEMRSYLEGLQKLGSQRGWWSRWSPHIGQSFETFLGIEAAAEVIRSWQPIIVPGLLQTEAYAAALAAAQGTPERAEHDVAIRRQRQELTWGDEPPTAWFVVDESVLHRRVGDESVMHEQLERLLDQPSRCTVQVVPLSEGNHAGTMGAMAIYEFDAELHTPVAWLDAGPAAQIYLEDQEVSLYRRALDGLLAVALSPAASAVLIRDVLAGRSTP